MKDNEQKVQDALSSLKANLPRRPWRENVVAHLIALGIAPTDRLELRMTDTRNHDAFAASQRAADTFFTAFSVYPTALVLHPANVALFEAAERGRLLAQHRTSPEAMAALMGTDFVATPIPFVSDAGLDTATVAARFELDMDAYQEAMLALLLRKLGEQ